MQLLGLTCLHQVAMAASGAVCIGRKRAMRRGDYRAAAASVRDR